MPKIRILAGEVGAVHQRQLIRGGSGGRFRGGFSHEGEVKRACIVSHDANMRWAHISEPSRNIKK
jgi:hypothetical protein